MLSEVDACILTAEGLMSSGQVQSDSKTDMLYQNIERLSRHVVDIKENYDQVIADGMDRESLLDLETLKL